MEFTEEEPSSLPSHPQPKPKQLQNTPKAGAGDQERERGAMGVVWGLLCKLLQERSPCFWIWGGVGAYDTWVQCFQLPAGLIEISSPDVYSGVCKPLDATG